MATANGLNIPGFTQAVANSVSNASAQNHVMEHRLTSVTATPVVGSATAVTTIYMTPFLGNLIALYDGSSTWTMIATAEISIAVPNTASTMYDVFCYNNAGTATLELLAWGSDTARSTALVAQDGVLVLTGSLTRRWIGCMRTTAVSGQTEDSATNRLVYNFYNQRPRAISNTLANSTWTYASYGAWRAANANTTTNAINAISGAPAGYQANCINLTYKIMTKSSSTGITIIIGIARDSIDPSTANTCGFGASLTSTASPAVCFFNSQNEPVGYHTYLPYEYLNGASDTATFSRTIGIAVGSMIGTVLG